MFNSPSLLFDLSGRHVTATLPGWGTGMARRMSLGDRLQNAISPRALSVFLTPAFISINKVGTRRATTAQSWFECKWISTIVSVGIGSEGPWGC